jgi:20S proteasome alpha/beta subunit
MSPPATFGGCRDRLPHQPPSTGNPTARTHLLAPPLRTLHVRPARPLPVIDLQLRYPNLVKRSSSERRPIRRSMTIAAGFTCTDGIVICADTELTGGSKFEGRKVMPVSIPGLCDLVITGTGTASYIGMASDLMHSAVYHAQSGFFGASSDEERYFKFHSVGRRISRKLHSQLAYFGYGVSTQIPDLLIGIRFTCDTKPEPPRLLQVTCDGGVCWVDDSVLGMGQYVARGYLRVLHQDRLPLELMTPLAIFVLYQSKLSAEACGGSTHVYKLPPTGGTSMWNDKSLAALTEDAMRLCLIDTNDRSLSLDQFNARATIQHSSIAFFRLDRRWNK